jgi:PAS domain S-box-containing protein
MFDENGKVSGNRGSNRDVTEKILAQQLLKESNQKYQLLSENISDGIFMCRNGILEYANKAMAQTFGYAENEMIGMKLTQLIAPDYLDELEVFHPVKVTSDRVFNVELECIRKDLSQISVEFLFNYLGNEQVIYGVAHDISDKKQIQKNIVKAIIQTEEKERAHFSKELHDGVGPLLSAIKLYLQWSLRTNTNISRDEIIQKAEDIIEEALTTVREISNKLSPHLLTNHGLSSAIQSFINKLRESSGIKITFDSDLKRRLGDEIEAALYRAIIECLNNTIKYGNAGNVSIMLNDADSQLLLHYKDDGIGFNLSETLAMKKGLGLFNLQNRIRTIGGKITLYSEPGKGVDYQITVNI